MDAVLHRDEVLRLRVEVDAIEVLELRPGGSRGHLKGCFVLQIQFCCCWSCSRVFGSSGFIIFCCCKWLIVGANVIEVDAHIANLILGNSEIPFEMI